MFDLEQAIGQWRQRLISGGIDQEELLDELEAHLRDSIEVLVGSGQDLRAAFEAAVREMGAVASVGREFQKLRQPNAGREKAVFLKATTCLMAVLAVAGTAASFVRPPIGLGGWTILGGLLLAGWRWLDKRKPTAGSGAMLRRLRGLSPDVRGVLDRARSEARSLGHDFIGTEHLLLALLRLNEGRISMILESFGTGPERIEKEIEESVRQYPAQVLSEDPPCTPRLAKALRLAARQAKALHAGQARAEHLLLGLLEERHGLAGRVLVKLGLTVSGVRACVS